MDIQLIKQELEFVFKDKLTEFLGTSVETCDDDTIISKFNEYASQHSVKVKIKDLVDNYQNKSFVVNTPDGFQEVGDFYIKGERNIRMVKTVDGYRTKCSDDHKFQTPEGWKFSKDIKPLHDQVLSVNGYKTVKTNKLYKTKEKVYDFEVLHPNHRYWSGNGLSSHNSGKTYIALSIFRNAQAMDYDIIYFDSEGAIDKDFVSRLGVDTSRFRLQPVNTIEEVNHISSKIIESVEEIIKSGGKPPKIAIGLDSLGNLSSLKELTDSVEANDKRDMTKQQAIRKLFRVNGMKFAKYGIPFVVNAHVYEKIGSYIPGKEVSGGGGLKYNVSIMFMLTKKKLDDKEAEQVAKDKNVEAVRVGVTITVTPIKQRFARPIKVELHIPFYKKPNPYVGLEKFASWDSCGIMRGKAFTEKQFDKLTDAEKKVCKEFEGPNGEKMYALPKDTARTLVCRHLKGETPLTDLFTSKVFTDEVLKELDEKVIKNVFMLPSIDSLEDLAELEQEMNLGENTQEGLEDEQD